MIYVYFFWDYLHMSQNLFNIGMIVYGIFNALNDPLLGQWSDRVNVNRWGSRRLIFIKYGGPIWAILFFVMWIPWSFDNSVVIFLHFIITMVFYDNFLTMVILVWDALLPEIAAIRAIAPSPPRRVPVHVSSNTYPSSTFLYPVDLLFEFPRSKCYSGSARYGFSESSRCAHYPYRHHIFRRPMRTRLDFCRPP